MSFAIGFGVGLPFVAGGILDIGAIVTLTNLDSDGAAEEGTAIGYTLSEGTATSQRWQESASPSGPWSDTGELAATETVQINVVHSDANYLRVGVTVDGTEYFSDAVQMRYARIPANDLASIAWVVDDANADINASLSDANLTFSYAISGFPSEVVIQPTTGLISTTGFVQADIASGSGTITPSDQYGRTYPDIVSWSVALRTQATAANGLGPYTWTVDDDTLNIDFAGDFTVNGNTLSYVVAGLPAGVSDDSDGTISGTPTAASSGTITITATDEYGRQTISTASHTTSLRTQATGGADLDLSFVEASAIATTNLIQNWTLNDNTPTTLVSISPSLPAGLSAAIVGNAVNLTGTPTTVTADATYTITVADEYGRQTADTFTLEITNAITINSVTVGTITSGAVPLTVDTVQTPDGTSTMYFTWVSPGSGQPSNARIKAGEEADGSPAVLAYTRTWTTTDPAAETTAITGAHDLYVLINNGVDSNVVEVLNVVFPSASMVVELVALDASQISDPNPTATWASRAFNGTGLITALIGTWDQFSRTISSVSIDGNAATVSDALSAYTIDTDLRGFAAYEAAVSNNSGDVSVTFSGLVNRAALGLIRTENGALVDFDFVTTTSESGTLTANVTAQAGDAIVAVAMSAEFSGSAGSFSGIAGTPTFAAAGSFEWFAVVEENVTAGAKAISTNEPSTSPDRNLAVFVFRPT